VPITSKRTEAFSRLFNVTGEYGCRLVVHERGHEADAAEVLKCSITRRVEFQPTTLDFQRTPLNIL
jgi:hypothetical protein